MTVDRINSTPFPSQSPADAAGSESSSEGSSVEGKQPARRWTSLLGLASDSREKGTLFVGDPDTLRSQFDKFKRLVG